MKDIEFKWSLIGDGTYVAKVPGGILFLKEDVAEEGFSNTMCFVPCKSEEESDWWIASRIKNKKG
ncbi:hypothetical protein E6Q11_02390 [Candidatus Dojkabacteria bacterium]|uniref:Uncharacterized protein n=1 Tax=Candidatus Dojkabacteria bacterium TaxID=2099670 RepID=A0A5C7J824_9BACT|nr:MAG: hypothetical protein E6Q11_02390 [Candidatus Dojkabacteria bacterium]